VLPYRKALIEGMLAANVIGFHLFEYARHFMTSCRRLLGLGENVGAGPAGGVLSINLGTRLVTITVSHVGIERDVICHRLKQPEIGRKLAALKQKYVVSGRKVIGGLEMLNPLQGAALKLLAYEQLLTDYPMWRERLAMVQVCFADQARPSQSKAYAAETRGIADRIRKRFGEEACTFLEVGVEIPPLSVNDRLVFLQLLDIYLNCAMRDGLNLLPFEYVATKSSMAPASDGILVLSEFLGCAHVLNGAMRINPFNLEHVVEQLDSALAMGPADRSARLAKDYDFVTNNSTATWLKVAVQDMRRVRSAFSATSPTVAPTIALAGWPGGLRPGEPVPRLQLDQVCRAYRNSSRRVILLGLDGTLIQQEHVINHLKNFHDFQGHSLPPPAAALHCLAALAADPANVIYVISGRTAEDMQATLGQVPGLGLAAELGFTATALPFELNSTPSLSSGADGDDVADRRWVSLLHALPPAAPDWRARATQLVQDHVVRTNGAYQRTQRSAIQWCYHDCDPDFGQMQANSLTAALRSELANSGVAISHSHQKGKVEVRLEGVNKGAAADTILTAADKYAPVDFLLCIGDDDDDEYMLSATTARACSPGLRERLHTKLFTVSVGSRPTTHAQYVASSSSQVLALLELLRHGEPSSGGERRTSGSRLPTVRDLSPALTGAAPGASPRAADSQVPRRTSTFTASFHMN